MFVAQLYSTKHLRGYVNHTVTPTATLARKLLFFRKYRNFNSFSNATHPIQIHKTVLEKLRFKKKV